MSSKFQCPEYVSQLKFFIRQFRLDILQAALDTKPSNYTETIQAVRSETWTAMLLRGQDNGSEFPDEISRSRTEVEGTGDDLSCDQGEAGYLQVQEESL